MQITEYTRINISIFDFKHDINGNTIARHALIVYRKNGTQATIYKSNRRKQTGSNGKFDDQINSILHATGFKELIGKRAVITGSRAENAVIHTYNFD